MDKHNKKNVAKAPMRAIADTDTARKAAIDWQWVATFANKIQDINNRIGSDQIEALSQCLQIALDNPLDGPVELSNGPECAVAAFGDVSTLLFMLKENAEFIDELRKIAAEMDLKVRDGRRQF